MPLLFTDLQETDLPFVKEVYDYYTLHTTIVYFIQPVRIEELKALIPIGNKKYRSYLVRTNTGEKCGFCYFTQFKPRAAFHVSVEITLYLKPQYAGKGYGKEILNFIEPVIREAGYKNIIALVSGENENSIRLFEKCGYNCCGNICQVAEKLGQKLDLKLFQKLM
ncbi:L-methionine sulfoximine/L-methionine sulfone acetyltransferase [termite gut metagenome]|uniref:L-methionine sulfoximine/L-methionine sulfone acetyltransferase n=1 Tax=termite gut metagenome TaxID=433724 RepID=A0A5J4R281_9ZZZZ